MPSHIKISAVLTARADRTDELKTLLVGMAPLCRAEPGNLRWDVWRDQTQADVFVLDELYVDDAAIAAHRETAHYQTYLLRIPDLAERTALVLNPVTVE